MIIRRINGNEIQYYCSPDIYGKGKWKSNNERSITDVPRGFRDQREAEFYIQMEQEKDPSWQYEVCEYDR